MSKPAVPEGHICPWINLCKLLINAVSLSIKIRKNKQGYVFLQLVPNVVVILSWRHISNDVVVWHVTSQTLSCRIFRHMKCNLEKRSAARGLILFFIWLFNIFLFERHWWVFCRRNARLAYIQNLVLVSMMSLFTTTGSMPLLVEIYFPEGITSPVVSTFCADMN